MHASYIEEQHTHRKKKPTARQQQSNAAAAPNFQCALPSAARICSINLVVRCDGREREREREEGEGGYKRFKCEKM